MPALRAAFLIPMDSASAFDSSSDRNCFDKNLTVKKKPNTCTIAIINRMYIVFEWERILGALAAMIAQIKTKKSIAVMEPSLDLRMVIILGVSFWRKNTSIPGSMTTEAMGSTTSINGIAVVLPAIRRTSIGMTMGEANVDITERT
jgi:hypothetical protein